MAKNLGKRGLKNIFKKTQKPVGAQSGRFSNAANGKGKISADDLASSAHPVVDVDFDEPLVPQRKHGLFGIGKNRGNDFLMESEPADLFADGLIDEETVGEIAALEQQAIDDALADDMHIEEAADKAEAQPDDGGFDGEAGEPGEAEQPDNAQIAADTAEKQPITQVRVQPFGGNKRKPLFASIKKFNNGFTGILARLAFWRQKPKGKNQGSVMAFASSDKRIGKKGRQTRRILIYAGAGLLAIAIVLVAVLVPWSEVTPADTQAGQEAPQEGTPSTGEALDTSLAMTVDDEGILGSDDEITGSKTIAVVPPTTAPVETPIPTTAPDATPKPFNMDKLIDDFVVEADLYYNEVGYSSNYYEYTDEEMYMMAQLIAGEAGGEPLEGRIAVGNVVMNRVLARGYPGSTIKSVILASGQFTGYNSNIKPHSSARYAARKVLNDQVWTIPQNVYFFNSHKPAGEDWGRHKFYRRIGGHNFYTDRYSGRSNNSAIPPELFERTFKWPRYGCKPEKRVYRIQYMLKDLGYDVEPDSYFGMDTVEELKKFQAKYELETDGVAGPGTIERLIREFGIEKYYKRFYD